MDRLPPNSTAPRRGRAHHRSRGLGITLARAKVSHQRFFVAVHRVLRGRAGFLGGARVGGRLHGSRRRAFLLAGRRRHVRHVELCREIRHITGAAGRATDSRAHSPAARAAGRETTPRTRTNHVRGGKFPGVPDPGSKLPRWRFSCETPPLPWTKQRRRARRSRARPPRPDRLRRWLSPRICAASAWSASAATERCALARLAAERSPRLPSVSERRSARRRARHRSARARSSRMSSSSRARPRRPTQRAGDDTRVTGEDDTALRARLGVAQWAPPDVVAAATAAAPRAAGPPAGAECDGDYVMNARGRAGAAAAVVVACDEDCLLRAGDLSGSRRTTSTRTTSTRRSPTRPRESAREPTAALARARALTWKARSRSALVSRSAARAVDSRARRAARER